MIVYKYMETQSISLFKYIGNNIKYIYYYILRMAILEVYFITF